MLAKTESSVSASPSDWSTMLSFTGSVTDTIHCTWDVIDDTDYDLAFSGRRRLVFPALHGRHASCHIYLDRTSGELMFSNDVRKQHRDRQDDGRSQHEAALPATRENGWQDFVLDKLNQALEVLGNPTFDPETGDGIYLGLAEADPTMSFCFRGTASEAVDDLRPRLTRNLTEWFGSTFGVNVTEVSQKPRFTYQPPQG